MYVLLTSNTISAMDLLEVGENSQTPDSQGTDPKKLIEKDCCIGYELNDGFYPMTNFTVSVTGMLFAIVVPL